MAEEIMEKIVSLCKRRGFIFPSSEIYGGIISLWDYGPLGVLFKNNLKNSWWKSVVQMRSDMAGLDSSILMHPQIWRASGHIESFADSLVDCKNCKMRFRADDLRGDKCPNCGGELTKPRMFNLMFKTFMGPLEEEASTIYLRPETAQGIFVNFKNVLNISRKKLPFGIAQIGKSFRNEITPGKFTFRTREFEQMEIEYFTLPEDASYWFTHWVSERFNWYVKLGIKKGNLRMRAHEKDELAHYAESCQDVEYNFPFGWSELEGIANRTDYDLRKHQEFSGKDLTYFDEEKNKHFIPFVIEPSGGVDRACLAFLVDAYDEDSAPSESGKMEKRVFLRLNPALSPYKASILPLMRKEPLVKIALNVYNDLKNYFFVEYDERGSIGKRYRRQDEIGTPFSITVDYQTLEDQTVTIRDRDTMKQERFNINELKNLIKEKLKEETL